MTKVHSKLLWFECFCSSKIHMLKLNPKVTVLGDGATGRWVGHEGWALINEISAFIKEIPESSLVPSTT